MFKRILALCASLLLLTSCSGNAVSLMEFMDRDTGKPDYDGVTITFDYEMEEKILCYTDDNSPQADAVRRRLADIEENLNVTFAHVDKVSVEILLSGYCPADIIYRSGGSSLVDFAYGLFLEPMTSFPEYIDLDDTDKYGTAGATEAALYKGVPYGIQPTLWPGMQGLECFFVAYNKDMLLTLGLTDLHEYYENETWTWDTFLNLLTAADPIVSENVQTFHAHPDYLLNTIFMSDGFDFIEVKDGKSVLNIYSDDAVHSLEFYKSLLGFENVAIESERWDITDFVEGNALMTMATAKNVTIGDIAYETDFNYCIMPFPAGSDIQYGKWAQSVTRISGFGILRGSSNQQVSAHVLSELFEPFEEFGTTMDELKQYYASSVFITDLDADIYFAVDDYVRYDYDDLDFLESFTGAIANSLSTGSSSPSELLQKYESVARTYYEKYLKENLDGYIIEKMNITE